MPAPNRSSWVAGSCTGVQVGAVVEIALAAATAVAARVLAKDRVRVAGKAAAAAAAARVAADGTRLLHAKEVVAVRTSETVAPL